MLHVLWYLTNDHNEYDNKSLAFDSCDIFRNFVFWMSSKCSRTSFWKDSLWFSLRLIMAGRYDTYVYENIKALYRYARFRQRVCLGTNRNNAKLRVWHKTKGNDTICRFKIKNHQSSILIFCQLAGPDSWPATGKHFSFMPKFVL